MSLNLGQSIREYFPGVNFANSSRSKHALIGGKVENLKVHKKYGVNGIHLDIYDIDNKRKNYVFHLAKDQILSKEIDDATVGILLCQFPRLILDEVRDALAFESSNLLEVLKLSREVYDFVVENKLCYASTRSVQRRTSHASWFDKAAKMLKYSWEIENYSYLTDNYRNILGDNDDDIFFIGRSRAAARLKDDSRCWREHIVPLSFIRDRVVELLEEGVSATELADFLFTHVRVVLLTNEERLLVDAEYQSTMPDGWEWYGDKFARLRICGIELE
jgi:hypothetical protein